MGGSCCSNRAPLTLDVKDPIDEVEKDHSGISKKKNSSLMNPMTNSHISSYFNILWYFNNWGRKFNHRFEGKS